MSSDGPIVEEVRRRRCEISSRFDDDIDLYGKHIQELQQKYRHRLVSQITVVPARPQVAPRGPARDKG